MYNVRPMLPSAQNNGAVVSNISESTATDEPMTGSVHPLFADGGVTGLKVAKAPRLMYFLFQGVPACGL